MSKLTPMQVIQSVIAAAIGVQSDKNRERDFKQGSATTFIVAGIIGTVLFILILVLIVSFIAG